MDLAGAREHAQEHDAVEQLKKSRRATWGPAIRTHLDTSALDETFLKKAADLAARRMPSTASLTPATPMGHDRPSTARLASTPEDPSLDPTDSHTGHTLIKRHTMYAMDKRKTFASAGSLKNPMHLANVRRWDAKARTTHRWDGLQRDPELFYPSGELLVHLHARGHSRRGPSFRLSLHRVHKMRCGPMFTLCFANETADSRNRRMPGAPRIYEIFIPSPQGMMREDAFSWHLTTRNFFAFLHGKPLVADNLGRALVDLQERAKSFRSEDVDNQRDIMEYMDSSGYLNFGHRPDYALAVLHYAEHFELRDLWIDAFAHCVGMGSILQYSPEFQGVRRRTKALISRAAVEMDLHIARGVKAMGNFLEDELSSSRLGLGTSARSHLDRFRSFLQQYYVAKFGYWPPRKVSKFPKNVYKSMYFDVRGLYEYLVDGSSSDMLHSQGLASGGICVLQNVQAFDQRHQYHPLPHPLPLLPNIDGQTKLQSQRHSFLSFTMGSKAARANRQHSVRTALHSAANTTDLSIVNAPLVKAYRQFERDCANGSKDDKVSIADARKVRWILIYCILQTLVSVTRAPEEVRDAERSEYPLCCTASCVPPWEDGIENVASPTSPAIPTQFPDLTRPTTSSSMNIDLNGMPNPTQTLSSYPSFEIHPDCETDASYLGKSRSNSTQSLTSLMQTSEAPTAVATNNQAPPLLRRNSSKASQTSQRSLKALTLGSFGSRRSSAVARPQSTFCEIIVHGYGNGLNETIVNSPSSSPSVRPDTSKVAPPALALPAGAQTAATLPARSTPRPHSSYIVSNSSSTSTILAPQPIRPLSAHAKESFRLPNRLISLNTRVSSEQMRTPTLDISQVDRLKDMMPREARQSTASGTSTSTSSKRTTPVSASDMTESEHNMSPVWSSRRGSASSQSSADISHVKPQRVSSVEDTAGLVDATPIAELRDVGGLLPSSGPANPARRGILVHRTFSVERFRVPTSSGSTANLPPNVQSVRKVRDQAFAAAQKKWKRKNVRYKEDIDTASVPKTAPIKTMRA